MEGCVDHPWSPWLPSATSRDREFRVCPVCHAYETRSLRES